VSLVKTSYISEPLWHASLAFSNRSGFLTLRDFSLAIPKVSPRARQALLLSGRRIEQLSRGSKKSPTPQSWMSGRKSFQPGRLCVYGVSVYGVISQTTPWPYVPPSDAVP
jgi:hypothetical protein